MILLPPRPLILPPALSQFTWLWNLAPIFYIFGLFLLWLAWFSYQGHRKMGKYYCLISALLRPL